MGAYRYLTDEEKAFIIENEGSMSIRQVCKTLGRSKGTVDKFRKTHGLKKDFHKPWSREEKDTILANPKLSSKELADILPGRDAQSIANWRSHNRLRYLRECPKCGSEFLSKVSATKMCDSCRVEGPYKDPSNPLLRLGYYKHGAKVRELDFALTDKEFFSFWQKPCTYCGDEIETIGLDRIDSSKGYTMENVTPCCSRCNEMKMADDINTWVSRMKKILQHMEKNNV